MKAYRVWVVFHDGVSAFASSAYELRARAEVECDRAFALNPSLEATHAATCHLGSDCDVRGIHHFEVREEELPHDHRNSNGSTTRIRLALLGDDEEQTDVEAVCVDCGKSEVRGCFVPDWTHGGHAYVCFACEPRERTALSPPLHR